MKTAIVAGATGLVGRHLINHLIASADYQQIHVLSRRPVDFGNSKVIVHQVDFDKIEEFEFVQPVHDFFCTLGTTMKKAGSKENFKKVDFEYVVNLATWAARHRVVKFLVISSMGANAKSSFFYNRVKGQMEQRLKGLPLNGLVIVRPSLIIGKRQESRVGEKVAYFLLFLLRPFLQGKMKRYRSVSGDQVARILLIMAEQETSDFFVIESEVIQGL